MDNTSRTTIIFCDSNIVDRCRLGSILTKVVYSKRTALKGQRRTCLINEDSTDLRVTSNLVDNLTTTARVFNGQFHCRGYSQDTNRRSIHRSTKFLTVQVNSNGLRDIIGRSDCSQIDISQQCKRITRRLIIFNGFCPITLIHQTTCCIGNTYIRIDHFLHEGIQLNSLGKRLTIIVLHRHRCISGQFTAFCTGCSKTNSKGVVLAIITTLHGIHRSIRTINSDCRRSYHILHIGECNGLVIGSSTLHILTVIERNGVRHVKTCQCSRANHSRQGRCAYCITCCSISRYCNCSSIRSCLMPTSTDRCRKRDVERLGGRIIGSSRETQCVIS